MRTRPFDRLRFRRYLDWAYDIAAIRAEAPAAVRRVGSLWVIDLAAAEPGLGPRAHAPDPRVKR